MEERKRERKGGEERGEYTHTLSLSLMQAVAVLIKRSWMQEEQKASSVLSDLLSNLLKGSLTHTHPLSLTHTHTLTLSHSHTLTLSHSSREDPSRNKARNLGPS